MQTLPNVKDEQDKKALARLGQINFINSLPVAVPMLRRADEMKAQIVFGTPSELNKQYAQNKLDLGAMSSFFYLESGDMQLLPDLSISSVGAVGSVLFFTKQDPRLLDNAKVAVPKSSATSINLLRILLLEHYGVKPIFVTETAPDLNNDDYAGALVIGDRALLVDSKWTEKFQRFDMGSWWFDTTKLPMTFGVWAAKSSWVSANETLFDEISSFLVNVRAEGLSSDLDLVIKQSMERLPISVERLRTYFTEELNFEFTADHRKGLELYRNLCKKYELFSKSPL